MLASLLLNLGKAGDALVAGVRLTFIPHAPEVTIEYESEQWANPTGKAPNRTLEIVLDRPAIATAMRAKPRIPAKRQVIVEAEWHATAEVTGTSLAVRHWAIDTAAGQTVDMSGTRLATVAHPAIVVDQWSAVASVAARRKVATKRVVQASAGATATFVDASYTHFSVNPPDVSGIVNPSPEEIVLMMYAARRSRIVRQFDNKKI